MFDLLTRVHAVYGIGSALGPWQCFGLGFGKTGLRLAESDFGEDAFAVGEFVLLYADVAEHR